MRVIFVGLHNKPGMKPLDSKTKSGKLIDRIIGELPRKIEVVKSNLFNFDKLPDKSTFHLFRDEWYWSILPGDDDIIVLLGAMTHTEFLSNIRCRAFIKVAHPASKRSHEEMNEYVLKTTEKIKSYF
jgi:hypothetical protein